MKQIQLLPFSHPTYLRRLVRALNYNRAGVYLSRQITDTESNPRLCGPASVVGGKVIRFPTGPGCPVYFVPAEKITEYTFADGGSGKEITASRH